MLFRNQFPINRSDEFDFGDASVPRAVIGAHTLTTPPEKFFKNVEWGIGLPQSLFESMPQAVITEVKA